MTEPLAAIADRLRTVPLHSRRGSDALRDLVVVPTLREAIVGNLLPPGRRLAEISLAKELKVSRTPVREAFALLEREGLVTVVPRVGVFVREVTPADVDEIYAVRAALESLAVKLATERLTPLGKAQLDETVKAMRAAVAASDPVAYTDALDRFYAVVMDVADNATLYRTHTGLLGPVRRLRRIAMTRPGRMKASFDQALRIKQAIERRDPSGPELMRVQLTHACAAAKAVLGQDAASSS